MPGHFHKNKKGGLTTLQFLLSLSRISPRMSNPIMSNKMNYLLGCVICFVSIDVLLQLSVFYHHHEENEASYAVWLSSKYVEFTLSE